MISSYLYECFDFKGIGVEKLDFLRNRNRDLGSAKVFGSGNSLELVIQLGPEMSRGLKQLIMMPD